MFFLKTLPTRHILEQYKIRFPNMDVDAVETALHQLRRASLLLRAIETYFAQYDLSQTQFLTLIILDREETARTDGLAPSAIADRLDVSRPVITDTIKTLLRKGLIESRPSPTDKRAKLIFLTEGGQKKLEDVLPGYYRVISEHG